MNSKNEINFLINQQIAKISKKVALKITRELLSLLLLKA